MEQGEVGGENVVEGYVRSEPGVVHMSVRQTLAFVGDDTVVDQLTHSVDTATETAAEQTDAHDAEDEPEDETDEQNIKDGRDGLDEGVDDNLEGWTKKKFNC